MTQPFSYVMTQFWQAILKLAFLLDISGGGADLVAEYAPSEADISLIILHGEALAAK